MQFKFGPNKHTLYNHDLIDNEEIKCNKLAQTKYFNVDKSCNKCDDESNDYSNIVNMTETCCAVF